MTPAQLLRRARARIEDPARWTRGSYAKRIADDGSLMLCRPNDGRATCWCAQGAVFCEANESSFDEVGRADATRRALAALRTIAVQRGYESFGHPLGAVFALNDDAGMSDMQAHAAVLRMYDRAIALAEKEQGT